jgi:hypothetical protein
MSESLSFTPRSKRFPPSGASASARRSPTAQVLRPGSYVILEYTRLV